MKKVTKKILGFKKDKLKQWFLYWFLFGIAFIILGFLVTSTWIGLTVRENCLWAESKYKSDCVESLIETVADEDNSFKQRNDAIWALGQIGDERAKESLLEYMPKTIPDREPYNEVISGYEIQKAVNLIESGFNPTKFIWKSGIN